MVPLARLVVGKRGALWAIGLSAVCQHAVAHGAQVKPYVGDLLVAEAVILGAALLLCAQVTKRGRAAGCLLLLITAALGPWLSYPSVFCLGAASAGLLREFWRRREQVLGWTWLSLNLLACLSIAALWYFVARHHHTASLQTWWASFFPDVSSPWAGLRWMVGYLIEVGHYGATGLGVPLLVLAAVAWVTFVRRSPALLLLVTLPLGLAWVAGVLRLYPLGDRLLFFAAPCLWLGAARGADAIVEWCDSRRPTLAWALMTAALLLPGAVRMVKDIVVRPGVVEFREAFAYVIAQRQPGDAVWVSHPQVYEVYHGRPEWLLGAYTPVQQVEEAARQGRLWMVFTPQTPGLTLFPDVFARVEAAGCRPVQQHQVQGLEIVLYSPAPSVGPCKPEVTLPTATSPDYSLR
jgi:hypothetical protein